MSPNIDDVRHACEGTHPTVHILQCGHYVHSDFIHRRRVYLSYLDSVKFFRPNIQTAKGESLRTMVYQELLCGYLDFVKRQGYVHMYIWACPPVSGEDYILYCHPDHQKVPKHKALREWYLRMLVKSKDEGVVLSVGNLYDLYLGGNVGRQQARPCEPRRRTGTAVTS